jgi:hypothetical protein
MKNSSPTIDDVIRPFFAARSEEVSGVKRRRIQRVEALLREYLESEVVQRLCENCQRLVAVERQFDPEGAVCRIIHADILIFALPRFLLPGWLQDDPLLQRAQLTELEALIGHLVYGKFVDYQASLCVQWELRHLIDQALRQLNDDRRALRRARSAAKLQAELAQWTQYREQQG